MKCTEARAMLEVREPIEVAIRLRDGGLLDVHGDSIDERCTEPWVMALGPFGSWPCTLADAEKDFAKHPEWWAGESFRLGHVVVYARGWGYAAVAGPREAAPCPG